MKKRFSAILLTLILFTELCAYADSSWQCPSCGKWVPGAFEVCTGCGADNIHFEFTVEERGVTVEKYTGSDEDVTVPDVILAKKVRTIGRGAFSGRGSLRSVALPDTLTAIEDSAFSGCEALTDVYYPEDEMLWGRIRVGEDNECLLKAAIHCGAVNGRPAENGMLDVRAAAEGGAGGEETRFTFDVIINGRKAAEGVSGYCAYVAAGSAYRIENITSEDGFVYRRDGGKTEGTVAKGETVNVCLNFRRVFALSYLPGAEDAAGIPEPQTKICGETLTLSASVPVREGYVFLGWSLSSGAAAADYLPGGAFDEDRETALYAVWERVYTISYNSNAGSDRVQNMPSGQKKRAGELLTLSLTAPSRTGYTFLGWARSGFASVADYRPGDRYAVNGDATLYAVWEKAGYAISYDKNCADTVTGVPSGQKKIYNEPLRLSDSVPVRYGYVFLGWSPDSLGETAVYASGGLLDLNEPVTLFAVWTKATYPVKSCANAGEDSVEHLPPEQVKVHGEALTLSAEKPVRTGYDFLGWALSPDAESAEYQPGDPLRTDPPIQLYAVWKKRSWANAYSANTDEAVSGMPRDQVKLYGEALILSARQPIREGYDFLGWALSPCAKAAEYRPGDAYTGENAATLYAVWEKETYTVAYDKNTGDTVGGMPKDQTKTYGETLTLSAGKPVREGHLFLGWALSPDAESADYQPGDPLRTDAPTRLYAVWEKETYSVRYNRNSADGVEGMPEDQVKIYGETLTLHANEPTREGFFFAGWAVSPTAKEALYQPGGKYTEDRPLTLYALWRNYVISYDRNTSDSVGGMPSDQTKNRNEKLVLSGNIPTRSGYIFLGWALSPDAAAADYQPGDAYTVNDAAMLYAVWARAEYRVTYDKNAGAEAVTSMPPEQTKTYGKPMTLSANVPIRAGYTFLGWAITATAKSAAYQPGGKYNEDREVTLYAVWEKATYAVRYNRNSADGVTGMPSDQTKAHGEALTLSGNRPTRTGYTFLGWATSATAKSAAYQPGWKYTENKEITLYAVWERISYSVKYLKNTTETVSGMPSDQVKAHGEALTLSGKRPTRTGYTFRGWATTASAQSAAYQPGGKYYENKAITLYAVWQRNTYKVSYEKNTTDSVSGMLFDQVKVHGETLTLSENVPTRTGYTFLGWATSSGARQAKYQPGGKYTANDSVTLYAVWEKATYAVRYNRNSADSVTGMPSDQTKVHGEALTLSGNKPARVGYTFLGWATTASAKSAAYQPGGKYYENKAITLYAVWSKKKDVKAGEIITFGHYPQNANGKDNTAIEWIVLEVNEKEHKALVISKYGLDAKPYNTQHNDVTWAECSLRRWLNGEFMNRAFTSAEQRAILETEVDNSKAQGYSGWSASGGKNTQDKIFLLSYAEANRYFKVTSENMSNTASRVAPTAHAKAQGAFLSGNGTGWWWLRSPGISNSGAAYVIPVGALRSSSVSEVSGCVRPAMWVDLDSGIN